MSRIPATLALGAAILLAPATLNAQKTFEGSVTYSMQVASMDLSIVHYVKGDKVRQEMSGTPMGNLVVLMHMGEDEATILMPERKSYMTMNPGAMVAMAQANADKGDKMSEQPEIKRTGEKETIAGHQCENVSVTTSQGTVMMCVATDLGFYMPGSGSSPMGRTNAAGLTAEMESQIRKEFGDGFFPLKVTASTGGQSVTMVATAVEKKSLADDMFEIPEGYTKMAGMGGG